jgi:LacI family transcriptional regulator
VFLAPPLVKRGKTNLHAQEERLRGVVECIECTQLQCEQLITKDYYAEVDRQLPDWLKKKTALFCSSDVYALRIMNHLLSKGISIPDDIGIMGFDHMVDIKYLKPHLSSIWIPVPEVAENAASMLIDLIEGKSPEKDQILETTLFEGDSV